MNLRRTLMVAAGVAALALGAAAVQLVSAHSRPIRFDPPVGAVLPAAPAQVTGWFTSELRNDPNWNFIHVADQNGIRVDNNQLSLSPDRRQMSVGLNPNLPPGRYIVTWRSWDDADGEIFGDCYVFYLGQQAADQAVTDKFRLDAGSSCQRIEVSAREGTPAPGATVTPSDEDTGGGTGSDGDSGVPIWSLVAGIGAGLAVGLVGGRLLMGTK